MALKISAVRECAGGLPKLDMADRTSTPGSGSPSTTRSQSGNIIVEVRGGAATLKGGIFIGDSARIGHGGRDFTGSNVAPGLDAGSSFYGDVSASVATGFDLNLLGGNAPTYDTDDGQSGAGGVTRGGLVHFYNPVQDDFDIDPAGTTNDVSLAALETALGLPAGALSNLTTTAAVRDAALRQLGLLADARAGRPSQLDGDAAFSLAPFATSSAVFYPLAQLQAQHAAMARVGHGGSLLGNIGPTLRGIERWEGNIGVNTATGLTGRDVILNGGDGADNFAMIGHGGHAVEAPISVRGNVTVNAARDLLLEGGDYFGNGRLNDAGTGFPVRNEGSFAQVGHMFTAVATGTRSESSQGDIRATAVRDIVLTGGGALYAQAMIGSGAKVGRDQHRGSPWWSQRGHRRACRS